MIASPDQAKIMIKESDTARSQLYNKVLIDDIIPNSAKNEFKLEIESVNFRMADYNQSKK